MKIVILTTVSNSYMEDFLKLHYSLNSYNSEITFLVEFVNINQYYVDLIKKIKNVKSIFTTRYFHNLDQLKGYCTNRRFYLFQKAFSLYEDHDFFIYTDANSIIYDDIPAYLKNNIKKQITLFSAEKNLKRPNLPKILGPLGTKYYGLIKGGCIILKNSNISKNFINDLIELNFPHKLKWYADQEALSIIYKNNKFKSSIEIKNFYDLWDKDNSFLVLRKSVSSSRSYDLKSRALDKYLNYEKFLQEKKIYQHRSAKIEKFNKILFLNLTFFRKIIKLKYINILKFFISYLTSKKYLVYNVLNFKIYLNNKLKDINRVLIFYGSREEDKCYLISKILNKNDHVIDCGSNIGYFPLIESSLIGPNGKIIMIEPDSRNIELLKKNKQFIKAKNIFFQKALSDKTGGLNFLEVEESNLSRVISHYDQINKYKSKKVDSITFKEIFETQFINNNKLKLIRMDIEGHEVNVLKSLIGIIKKIDLKNLHILIEVHPEIITNEKKMPEFISYLKIIVSLGFSFRYIVESSDKKKKFSLFDRLNILKSKKLYTDNYYRNLYEDIPSSEAIELISAVPKQVRYFCLKKD